MPAAPSRASNLGRLGLTVALPLALLAGCGNTPSPSATSGPSVVPSTGASSNAPASPGPSQAEPTPVATPPGQSAAPASCSKDALTARVTAWDAGAGHRIAHVELKNTGAAACSVPGLTRPQLVDGNGNVLIEGAPVAVAAPVTITPGASVAADVQDGNYCGNPPTAPVTVAFELPAGSGRVVAAPLSPTDVSGVPPCLGAVPATIEMQPWAP